MAFYIKHFFPYQANLLHWQLVDLDSLISNGPSYSGMVAERDLVPRSLCSLQFFLLGVWVCLEVVFVLCVGGPMLQVQTRSAGLEQNALQWGETSIALPSAS